LETCNSDAKEGEKYSYDFVVIGSLNFLSRVKVESGMKRKDSSKVQLPQHLV